jgi:hypothetical protein
MDDTNNLTIIEIEKNAEVESTQVESYYLTNTGGKTVVKPTYNRELLTLAFKDSTNRRCIEAKANAIAGMGYYFVDEENAKQSGVVDFLNGLYAKDGSPKPFSMLLKELWVDYEIYGESRLELLRLAGQLENLLVLSGRNTTVTPDRKTIYQYDRMRNKIVQYARYGKGSRNINDTLVISRNTPEDDYYGVPCYVSALGSIEINKKITETNSASMSNIVDPSIVLLVSGYTLTNDEKTATKESLQNIKANRSASAVFNFGNPNAKVDVQNFGAKPVDGNYLEERKTISLEIMSLHGLTPELFGALINGGISSGEKASGALKIFIQTECRPNQDRLERLVNELLKNEFPGYNTEFKLKSLDLTDTADDSTTELTKVQTIQNYVNMGSKRLLNDYLTSIDVEAVTDDEWLDLAQNINDLPMNIAKRGI